VVSPRIELGSSV